MKNFFLGVLVSSCICAIVVRYFSDKDMEIMIQQNELLILQQQILEEIEINCDVRNWLSFGDEIYVCMHINELLHQLSQPEYLIYKLPPESQA